MSLSLLWGNDEMEEDDEDERRASLSISSRTEW